MNFIKPLSFPLENQVTNPATTQQPQTSKKHPRNFSFNQNQSPSTSPSSSPDLKKRKTENESASRVQQSSLVNGVEPGLSGVPVNGVAKDNNKINLEIGNVMNKKEKKVIKKEVQYPQFHFDTGGLKNGRTVQLKDVRDLVLFLLADEKEQNWLFVEHKRLLHRIVVLFIPGITPSLLDLPISPTAPPNHPIPLGGIKSPSKLPIFKTLFSHALPTKAPGDNQKLYSCSQNFLICQMTEKDRKKKVEDRKATFSNVSFQDPKLYMLSTEQMSDQTYPSCISEIPNTAKSFEERLRSDGWIETSRDKGLEGEIKVLGVDCEMCLTEDGSELCRVSVVDMEGKSIYDSLVKPDKPILDFLTRYSGITAKRLEGVTTRLIDVQKKICELVDENTILLGHSLECDLKVLKLAHPYVIDTSVIYQHPRGQPYKPSLKWLAQKWLSKEIQKGDSIKAINENKEAIGHDSEEDARACCELLKMKMQKGPGFGEFITDSESIFDRLAKHEKTTAVIDYGNPNQWHGNRATKAVACKSDQEVAEGILTSMNDHHFVYARFMELSNALGWNSYSQPSPTPTPTPTLSSQPSTPLTSPTKQPSLPPTSTSNGNLEDVLEKLNQQIVSIHSALPKYTGLIIYTGHEDPREMTRLTHKRNNFERMWKVGLDIGPQDRWMAEDDRNLTNEVEKVRRGLSFYLVK